MIRKYRFYGKRHCNFKVTAPFLFHICKVMCKTAIGIIKARFFDEVQGKKAKNPDGL